MSNGKKSIQKYIDVIIMMIVCFFVFLICVWSLTNDHYFLWDDISHLRNAKFTFDIKNWFTVFPVSRYNDRPLRDMFFYILYHAFGLQYEYYYFVCIIIHLINVVLLYEVVKNSTESLSIEPYTCRIIAAFSSLMWGGYTKNLMAVWWISGAANDELCVLFALLAAFFYIRQMKYKGRLSSLFCIMFYILAMRSKEATVFLPIIFLLFALYSDWRNSSELKRKLSWCDMGLLLYMTVYIVRLFSFPNWEGTEYEQSFSPLFIMKGIINYVRLYFGLDDSNFSYDLENYYTKLGNVGVVLLIIFLIAGIIFFCANRKSRPLIAGIFLMFIMTGLAIAPVLTLERQHQLYIYYPAIFLSVIWGILLYGTMHLLKGKINNIQNVFLGLLVCVGCLLVMINYTGSARILHNMVLLIGQESKSAVKDIEAIERVPTGANVYIEGASDSYSVLFGGYGAIVNILYDDNTINVVLSDNTERYEEPYVLWNYEKGHITERERK